MDNDFIESLLKSRRSLVQALADLREKFVRERSPRLRRMIEQLEVEIAERMEKAAANHQPEQLPRAAAD